MLAAVWPRLGLLLSLLSVCVCQEQDPCVLGEVGGSVSLHCLYPPLLTSANVSVEWRKTTDQAVVLRSEWTQDGRVHGWSGQAGVSLPADAAQTGNVSLQLSAVLPTENRTYYSLFVTSEDNSNEAVCTVCLTAAASFSPPMLQSEVLEPGDLVVFRCESSGGFPEPRLQWKINESGEPPEGSVVTAMSLLPDSHLYNITSHMTVNVSADTMVYCTVHNPVTNQSSTSSTEGVKRGPVKVRATEAMWMFSTGLCVVVGVMVMVGVGYQIHLDRLSKKKKKAYHRYMSSRPITLEDNDDETLTTMRQESRESRETDV